MQARKGSDKGPYVVGLTGGIASGKSAVAAEFAALGIPVIDADHLSREVVAPGSELLTLIAAHFGNDILQTDGSLDRATLRQRIFADATARTWLEQLLHPVIRQRIRAKIAASTARWLIVMVPLLLEGEGYDVVQRVLVVDAPPAVQRARAQARDGTDAATLAAIMARQLPRAQRLARADDVIDNSGPQAALTPRVAELAARYEELAHEWHQTS
ncbi:MAG: dephospho-CoA kinase [Pseudomonadales bacterium]|jgi:dephospho-CoA kinase|nr:dephospho-CoA kinase [Pseudomonadales bacterium]